MNTHARTHTTIMFSFYLTSVCTLTTLTNNCRWSITSPHTYAPTNLPWPELCSAVSFALARVQRKRKKKKLKKQLDYFCCCAICSWRTIRCPGPGMTQLTGEVDVTIIAISHHHSVHKGKGSTASGTNCWSRQNSPWHCCPCGFSHSGAETKNGCSTNTFLANCVAVSRKHDEVLRGCQFVWVCQRSKKYKLK